MNNTRIYYKITIEPYKYAHKWTKTVKTNKWKNKL